MLEYSIMECGAVSHFDPSPEIKYGKLAMKFLKLVNEHLAF